MGMRTDDARVCYRSGRYAEALELLARARADERRDLATPLLVALLFVEITDVVFAVDSVPAIYALTGEPLIVFTSNVFAILGLRALYFLLGGAVTRFHMLKYALSLVLVFVGLKMVWLNDLYGGKFPIAVSLAIIAGLVAAGIVLSLVVRPRAPGGAASTGAARDVPAARSLGLTSRRS